MARITSDGWSDWGDDDFAFDMYNFDLTSLLAAVRTGIFVDNDAVRLGGISYSDSLWFEGDEDSALSEHTVLAGNALTFDPLTKEIGGTIQAMGQVALSDGPGWDSVWATPPDYNFAGWTVTGLSLSGQSVYDAATTLTLVDDIALLRGALSGDDVFDLGGGDDRALGFAGNDLMRGNEGDDVLLGGLGGDRLFGGDGHDQLRGEGGNDVVRGGSGRDTLWADTGSDRLEGGRGADVLHGGLDALGDRFVLTSALDSLVGARDRILNFTGGADRIDLQAIDVRAGISGDQAFGWNGRRSEAYSAWWVDSGSDVLLRADLSGDRTAEIEILVRGVAGLTGGDLLL